jgi:hypothetical protein
VRIRAVLRDSLHLFAGHWRHFLTIGVAVYVVLALITTVIFLTAGPYWATAVLAFFFLTTVYWVEGPIAVAVDDVRDGRADLTARETLRSVAPKMNRLSIAAVLAGLGVYLGFFTIVVGFLLLVRWSLLAPVIMLEDTKLFPAFRRSWQLVGGASFRVFAIVLVSVIVFLAGFFVGVLLLAMLPDSPWAAPVAYVFFFGPSVTAAVFISTLWAVTFFALRDAKTPETLAPAATD